jgi:hypothetical protein
MDYERAAKGKRLEPDQNLPHTSPYTNTIRNSRPYLTLLKTSSADVVTRIIFGKTKIVQFFNIFPDSRGSFVKRNNTYPAK